MIIDSAAADAFRTCHHDQAMLRILSRTANLQTASQARGPRHHGVHLFQKDPLAGLLGCDFEAAIGKGNLFHASILSSHGLERPSFADFP
jgi:hypothetical protein